MNALCAQANPYNERSYILSGMDTRNREVQSEARSCLCHSAKDLTTCVPLLVRPIYEKHSHVRSVIYYRVNRCVTNRGKGLTENNKTLRVLGTVFR